MFSADRITNTCCFQGHREICEEEELKSQIYALVEMLILEKKVELQFQVANRFCNPSLQPGFLCCATKTA